MDDGYESHYCYDMMSYHLQHKKFYYYIIYALCFQILYFINSKITTKAVIHRLPFTYACFIGPTLMSVMMSLAYWETNWSGAWVVWMTSVVICAINITLLILVATGM